MCDDIQIIKDIQKAVDFCEKQYTQEEIFEVLNIDSSQNSQTDIEKQICILKLVGVNSQKEADLLVFHLTNHHGLVREAAATKINEFFKDASIARYFQTKNILDSLLKAVNDINPNICRTIIDILPLISDKDYFIDKLYQSMENTFVQLEELKRSNMYTKKLFNLYWGLEALAQLRPNVDENLELLLKKCVMIRDYTIREKTAYLINCLNDNSDVVEQAKKLLKQDTNYYVRRYTELW